MRPALAMVIVSGILANSPAGATYVVPNGALLLSHGDGFRPLNDKTEVAAGDTVVAAPGGHGKIVYPDGCVIAVTPGNVVTVEDRAANAPQRDCKQPSDSGFNVNPTLFASPDVGVIIATDAEHLPPWPAGP
jgi:hypothetical protein